ncbi:MAG: ABC transporter substrate-binding protein [Caldilineaceae bacterium]|nr:ABC transporter substrate-binding protein [Caldilineaceae bacterium]MCB0138799.1 ABC transporter substrate-binding protein [Caldilineaceae bacterium]MCB9147584.1 ABC transporter substrate-binding protein [Caldilineaceae bacterium]
MNRRILVLLSVLMVAMLALTACPGSSSTPADSGSSDTASSGGDAASSGDAASTEGTKITAVMGSTIREGEQAAIDYCIEQTGLEVEVVNGPESATDRIAQYLQFFGAQSSDVDVLMIDVIWPGILAEHLIDLSPYVDNPDDYFQRIIQNNTVDGALVGIPWFTDAGLLYYRTDLLEKYGYDAPPTTWSELQEMATKIQEGERADNPDFWGFVWQGNAYEGLTCDALEWQVSNGGGEIVEADGTISINNEYAAAAFDQAAGWVDTISPPGVVSYQEEDARGVWQAGNAAFMRNWPYAYSLGNADDSAIKGNLAVVPLPKGDGPDARNADTLGGWQMAVSKYSEHPEAAGQFAACIAGKDAQKLLAIGDSKLPTIGSLYEDAEVLDKNPFFSQLFDVFNGGAVARPSTVTSDKYNEVSTIYFTEVNKVLTGAQTGQQAVESIESQLQDLLQ